MGRPRSDISQRIVRAARVRFLHEGVDGASQRRIARDASTSLGMVYYYFPTKDKLFLAVVEDVYGGLVAELEHLLGDGAPVEERVRRLFRRLAALTDVEMDVVRIVVREGLISNARRRQLLERFLRGHVALVMRIVLDGLASGAFRPIDPPFFLVAAMVGAGLVPQVMRRVVGPDVEPFALLPTGEAYVNLAVDVLLRGIGGSVPSAALLQPEANTKLVESPVSSTSAKMPRPVRAATAGPRGKRPTKRITRKVRG